MVRAWNREFKATTLSLFTCRGYMAAHFLHKIFAESEPQPKTQFLFCSFRAEVRKTKQGCHILFADSLSGVLYRNPYLLFFSYRLNINVVVGVAKFYCVGDKIAKNKLNHFSIGVDYCIV